MSGGGPIGNPEGGAPRAPQPSHVERPDSTTVSQQENGPERPQQAPEQRDRAGNVVDNIQTAQAAEVMETPPVEGLEDLAARADLVEGGGTPVEPATPAPEPEALAPEPTPTTTDSEAPGVGQYVPAQTEKEYREEVEAEEAAEAHAASSEEQTSPATAVSLPVSERTESVAPHEPPSEPGAGGEAAGLTAEEPQPEPAVEPAATSAAEAAQPAPVVEPIAEPVVAEPGVREAATATAATEASAERQVDQTAREAVDQTQAIAVTAPPAEGPGVGRPEQAESQPVTDDWEEYLAKYGNNYAPGREPKPGQKTLDPDKNVTINEMLRRHGYGMPRPDRDEEGRVKRDKGNNIIMRPTTLDDIIADIKANKEHYNGSMTEDARTPLEKQDQRTLEQIKSDATEYHEQKERAQLDADAKKRDELLNIDPNNLTTEQKKELEGLQAKLEHAEAQKRASLERQAKAYRAPRGNFGKFIDDAFDAVTGKTAAKEQAEFMRTGKVVFGSEMQLFSDWLARRKIPVISKLFGTEMSEKDINAAKKRIADFAPIMMEAFKKAAPRRLLQIYLIFALLFSPAGIMVLSALATGQAFKMMGKSQ